MAEIVAEMVQDGDHIFLDASTTAVFIAKALKDKERLTVITNSMEILIELSDVSGWNIISTGGVMKEHTRLHRLAGLGVERLPERMQQVEVFLRKGVVLGLGRQPHDFGQVVDDAVRRMDKVCLRTMLSCCSRIHATYPIKSSPCQDCFCHNL